MQYNVPNFMTQSQVVIVIGNEFGHNIVTDKLDILQSRLQAALLLIEQYPIGG